MCGGFIQEGGGSREAVHGVCFVSLGGAEIGNFPHCLGRMNGNEPTGADMPCKKEKGLVARIVVISPNELLIYLRVPHTRLPGSLLPLSAELREFLK